MKNTLPAAPRGRRRRRRQGSLKDVFENGTYFQTCVWKWTIFGSFYFETRHRASFAKFHDLVGGRKLLGYFDAEVYSKLVLEGEIVPYTQGMAPNEWSVMLHDAATTHKRKKEPKRQAARQRSQLSNTTSTALASRRR